MDFSDVPIYLPFGPMARKKRTFSANSDSYRIFGLLANEYQHMEKRLPEKFDHCYIDLKDEEPAYEGQRHHRFHNPQSLSCSFLRENPKCVNEPVCKVLTAGEDDESRHWIEMVPPVTRKRPAYSLATLMRSSYQGNSIHQRPQIVTRHSSNPEKEPLTGIVPVTSVKPKDWEKRFNVERISYENMYNARTSDNYTRRGKRHGCFVWDKMSPEKAEKIAQYLDIPSKGIGETGEQFWNSYKERKL